MNIVHEIPGDCIQEQLKTLELLNTLRRHDLSNLERVRAQAAALRDGISFEAVAEASRAGRSGQHFPVDRKPKAQHG